MLDLIETNREAEAEVETVTVIGMAREAETRRNVGRFIRAMWVAVFMLLLFNSAQLVTVVNGFGVGPVQDTVVAVVTTWNEQMEKNGLSKPVEVVRGWVVRMRDAKWTDLPTAHVNDRGAQVLRGPQDGERG